MKYIERAFAWLAWVFCLGVITFLFTLWAMPAKTLRYDLSVTGNSSLAIIKIVDWSYDETIPLDRNVTYEQAIQMVKELNTTIK